MDSETIDSKSRLQVQTTSLDPKSRLEAQTPKSRLMSRLQVQTPYLNSKTPDTKSDLQGTDLRYQVQNKDSSTPSQDSKVWILNLQSRFQTPSLDSGL